EVRGIARLMRSPTVLLGGEATGGRLRDLAASGSLARYELLHFATHAEVDEIWLGRSALVFNPGDRRTPETSSGATRNPGSIDVDEIASSWNLDADLVALAACRTFTGPGSGTDGYLGLHQALLGAGARQVLATLWPVDDQATGLLMSRFYRVLLASSRDHED